VKRRFLLCAALAFAGSACGTGDMGTDSGGQLTGLDATTLADGGRAYITADGSYIYTTADGSFIGNGNTNRDTGTTGDGNNTTGDGSNTTGDGSTNRDTGTDDTGTSCLGITCALVNATCGLIGDGCGGVIDCGNCPAPQTCGGGGTPSQCGGSSGCTPTTCAAQNANCGPIGDGCGGVIDCGSCGANESCGAGGPSRCGPATVMNDGGTTCTPRTCTSVNASCGQVADGCGGLLNCGTCTAPESCGGGGTPNRCGRSDAGTTCTPRTCAGANANCGPVADGCGGIIQCGTCTSPQICGGGGTPSRCGSSTADGGVTTCTNLCLQQVRCESGTTTVTGIVRNPGGGDPLFGALVYVPNAAVAPFTNGVACDQCGSPASGSPLVSATTGADGRFTLTNVPVGTNIPLVIQLGRWRRQVRIPTVTACVTTDLNSTATLRDLVRLPKNSTEGDIPRIAMVTGSADALECVLRKMGLESSVFGNPNLTNVPTSIFSTTARIHFYRANGARFDGSTPPESSLWSNQTVLNAYDVVLLACEGSQLDQAAAETNRMITYSNLGGRIFATHYSYAWFYDQAPWSGVANWAPDPNLNRQPQDPLNATIDTTFPKGMAFAQWLVNVGASTTLGRINISDSRHDVNAVVAPTQRWLSGTNTNTNPSSTTIQHLTFNAPIGQPAAMQCGRVLFSDFHVNVTNNTSNATFPAECSATFSAQEKILEFMLFDISSCITADVPTCTPRTCQQQNANCGQTGDGCGGIIACGACTAPQTCGGGGVPSQCGGGGGSCTPTTCAAQNANCGPISDGCNGVLQCGTCTAPQTCGGGGTPSRCGGGTTSDAGTCAPRTCTAVNANCGAVADGCGGILQCGNCPPGQTCGGGGMPNRCGGTGCTPRTCQDANANCGAVADGCGGVIQCGTCTAPDTCGGAGLPNRCGNLG